jgi:hypothetical protein
VPVDNQNAKENVRAVNFNVIETPNIFKYAVPGDQSDADNAFNNILSVVITPARNQQINKEENILTLLARPICYCP